MEENETVSPKLPLRPEGLLCLKTNNEDRNEVDDDVVTTNLQEATSSLPSPRIPSMQSRKPAITSNTSVSCDERIASQLKPNDMSSFSQMQNKEVLDVEDSDSCSSSSSSDDDDSSTSSSSSSGESGSSSSSNYTSDTDSVQST